MLQHIEWKKGKVTFSDRGKGRAVVLIHGFLGASVIWEDLAMDLARTYRVISIDLPGHGRSDCFGYAHSMELMARCVKAVLDHARLKRYTIIGHSMGGYVALAFAELFPDHLRGLALLHSTGYPDNNEKRKDRERAIALIRKNRRIYTQSTIRNLFAAKNLKYLKKEIAFANKIAASTSRQGMVAALLGMRDRRGRDIILSLVEYPILMVIGEQDNLMPASQLLEQSKVIRNCDVLYLEHDGHMGFLESPVAVTKAIRKFLRKC
jgi:pimeloyl-ACP methyl ester carboxylesterase